MEKILLKLQKHFEIKLPLPPSDQKGIIVIRGSNGSGKTTMLRVLSSKFDLPLDTYLQKNASHFLLNSAVFFEESTVVHNESLIKNLAHVNSILDFNIEKQNLFIKQLGLTDILKRKFNNCSTGEKKKFLTVLNLTQNKKKIYYLDEPLENIDTKSISTLILILSREFTTDKTLYMTTHSPEKLGSLSYNEFNLSPQT